MSQRQEEAEKPKEKRAAGEERVAYCDSASLCRLMRWKLLVFGGRSVRFESYCVDCGRRGAGLVTRGEEGRLLEELEGRPLSRLLEEPLEELEKETLWPGDSKLLLFPLPSDVFGRCHRVYWDMVGEKWWLVVVVVGQQ